MCQLHIQLRHAILYSKLHFKNPLNFVTKEHTHINFHKFSLIYFYLKGMGDGEVDYKIGGWFYGAGKSSTFVANLKSSGNKFKALGYINLYDCRMVTSAVPAISPISF